MSSTVRLEMSTTFLVWHEVVLPDQFDASDPETIEQLFSDIPYPNNPGPQNGRAEIATRIAWRDGRICYFRCFDDGGPPVVR